MTYPLFILLLLILLYYFVTKVSYEGFTSIYIDDQKSHQQAVNNIKKIKKVLVTAEKESVIVVVPSIDPKSDKQVEQMIRKHFEPRLYNTTVVTYTDTNLIKEFLSNLTPVTPNKFPAFFRINKSISENNHLSILNDKPNIIQTIEEEYKRIRNNGPNKEKEKEKDKKKNKKDKKENKGNKKGKK